MGSPRIDEATIRRLLARAQAERWHVTLDSFGSALHTSAAKAFAAADPSTSEVRRYLEALHLEDLALACACAAGDEAAWEFFVLTVRPVLYRAADALDPGGGARELADSLYADLYGLSEKSGERQSLFRYFHGRSSLATWLRAVLAQRHIDRVRTGRRMEALPEEESSSVAAVTPGPPDPDRERYVSLVRDALAHAIVQLEPRDRLRLGCYYAQDMTLAAIGRLLGEHEATVSRNLARVRRAVREEVERDLRSNGLSDAQIEECFQSVTEDAGSLDLDEVLVRQSRASQPGRDRSMTRRA